MVLKKKAKISLMLCKIKIQSFQIGTFYYNLYVFCCQHKEVHQLWRSNLSSILSYGIVF